MNSNDPLQTVIWLKETLRNFIASDYFVREIFAALDLDGDGAVTEQEFVR